MQSVQLVRNAVLLGEIVLKQCYLDPPWPLADLVNRGHRSSRFHTKLSHLLALHRLPPVLQRDFHSSNSSMLNRIVFPCRPCSRYRSCAPCPDSSLDREQHSVLAGVSPLFVRSSLHSSVSRVSLRSRLSFQCCFVLGTCHFRGSGCFVGERGAVSIATPYPNDGFYRVQLYSQFLHSQWRLCGAQSTRPAGADNKRQTKHGRTSSSTKIYGHAQRRTTTWRTRNNRRHNDILKQRSVGVAFPAVLWRQKLCWKTSVRVFTCATTV